jgi:hypothetical protein
MAQLALQTQFVIPAKAGDDSHGSAEYIVAIQFRRDSHLRDGKLATILAVAHTLAPEGPTNPAAQ